MVKAPASASPAWSPVSDTQLTCCASEWMVAAPVWPGRYTLTARSCSGATRIATGSLSTCAPGGIWNEALPPTVTRWIVPGATAAPEPATATVTSPTCSGVVPKTFVSTRRTRAPPALVNTMLRTV